MSTLRAASILAGFFAITVPLMPVQALLLRVSPSAARRFPHWYHRQVCRLLGVRIAVEGRIVDGCPVLLVSNHTSWLDIPVLSAVAPVSFVAKKEVAGWPFVSALARLQRTVFVDRERRGAVQETAHAITDRLSTGDIIVFFAEGTSSDGNRVLPFTTSLFAAARPAAKTGGEAKNTVVQTLSLVYTRLHGVPFGRSGRTLVGWYGDMEMRGHAWQLLKAGPLDVHIRIGAPILLESFSDRKDLARKTEEKVREDVVRILRARPDGVPVVACPPPDEVRKAGRPKRASDMWQ